MWSIHVRGTAASSAPVPMPMLPDVGICCNTLGCVIPAQIMLHCVTSFLVSVLLCHPYIFTIFVEICNVSSYCYSILYFKFQLYNLLVIACMCSVNCIFRLK